MERYECIDDLCALIYGDMSSIYVCEICEQDDEYSKWECPKTLNLGGVLVRVAEVAVAEVAVAESKLNGVSPTDHNTVPQCMDTKSRVTAPP